LGGVEKKLKNPGFFLWHTELKHLSDPFTKYMKHCKFWPRMLSAKLRLCLFYSQRQEKSLIRAVKFWQRF